jgi:N-acetylneuraminic acid mutarotase
LQVSWKSITEYFKIRLQTQYFRYSRVTFRTCPFVEMTAKVRVAVNALDKASWSNLANMHSQREGGSAVAIPGNKILVVGGYHVEEKFLKSCAVLDLTTQQWSDYPPMKNARMGCAAVYLEQHNAVVVVGGFQRGRKYLNTAEYLDLSTQRWHRTAPMHVPRAGCAAVTVLGKRVVVLGGWKDGETAVSTVEVLDFSAQQWHYLPEMTTPRAGCAAAAVGSTVMVLGGHTTSGKSRGCRSSVECLDLSNQTWSRLPSMRQKRDASACVTVGNCVFVIGGGETSTSPLDSVEMLDLETKTWKELPPMGSKRFGCAAAAIQNRVIVIGGRTSDGKHLDTVELLQLPVSDEAPPPSLGNFLDKGREIVPSSGPDDAKSMNELAAQHDADHDKARAIKNFEQAKNQANEMYERTVDALQERLKIIDRERQKIKEHIEKAERERDDAILQAEQERKQALTQIQQHGGRVGSSAPEAMVPIEDEEPPSELCCCITGDLMDDPVTAMDGHTYERTAIEAWYARFNDDQNPTSPLTGEPIPSRRLIPSHNIRSQCKTWQAKLKKGEPEEIDPLANLSSNSGSNHSPRIPDRRAGNRQAASRRPTTPTSTPSNGSEPATDRRRGIAESQKASFRRPTAGVARPGSVARVATAAPEDAAGRGSQQRSSSRRGSTDGMLVSSDSKRVLDRRTSN